jgi:hypothetical protein
MLWRVRITLTINQTPRPRRYSISAVRRSVRWDLPPPPGRSSAHSFRGRAHQIRGGADGFAAMPR